MSQNADLLAGDEMRRHTHEMIMMPKFWSIYDSLPGPPLSWSVFPFNDASRVHVPDQPGVYAFLVEPGVAGNLNVSYLMYIGMTERTLRARFSEYLTEAKSDRIRPKLLRILPQYTTHLRFACAVLPEGVAPAEVEVALLDAFVPPGNDRVPATVARIRKAF